MSPGSRITSHGPFSCWAVLVLTFGALGCGVTGKGTSLRVHERFIADDDLEIFSFEHYLEESGVFEWSFEDPEQFSFWRVEGGPHSEPKLVEGGFETRLKSGDELRFVRDVDFDASSVDQVKIDLSGLTGGNIRVYWAREGQPLDVARSIESLPRQQTGLNKLLYVVPVSESVEWKGRIRQLALVPDLDTPARLRLLGVQGTRLRLLKNAVTAAIDRAWKVARGTDLRSALLAPVGRVIRRDQAIPEDAQFRVAYGIQNGVSVPTGFRVAWTTASGSTILFEDQLNPIDERKAPQWHEVQVDLSPFAGQEGFMSLETYSEGADNLQRGFPVWANPEVLQRVKEVPSNSVVVVSLDTLRADHLSLYGYDRPTSPNLERWAAERAMVFENAVTASPWTLPSHMAIFTGKDALTHGRNFNTGPTVPLTMMAERFRRAGYATYAITGGGFMHPEFGFAKGFDRYFYWGDHERSDQELEEGLARAMRWLDGLDDRPVFLFFHTYEIHSPYRARSPYYERLGSKTTLPADKFHLRYRSEKVGPEDGFKVTKFLQMRNAQTGKLEKVATNKEMRELVLELYDSGIAYTDAKLAVLLEFLEDRGLGGTTAVVITSDHGEALGEKGLAGHQYLYDFNVMVPLVVALPDRQWAGRRFDQQVSTVDILPTVLEIADLERPSDLDGKSLLQLAAGDQEIERRVAWTYAASANRGVSARIDNRLKYILNNTAWIGREGSEELYDLAIDPEEDSNTIDSRGGLSTIRDRVLSKLASQPGVRVRLANNSGGRLLASLRSQMVSRNRVKVMGLPCGCVRWVEDGHARIALENGQSVVLAIEVAQETRMDVSVEGEVLKPLELTLPPSQVQGGVSWIGNDDSWEPVEAVTEGQVATFSIWRVGESLGTDSAAPELSGALSEQLRALGYVP